MIKILEVNDVYFEVEYSYYESPSGNSFTEVDDIRIADISLMEVLSDFVIQKIEEKLQESVEEEEWNANEDKGDAQRKYDE